MTTYNQQRPDNRIGYTVLIMMGILAAILILSSCGSVNKSQTTTTKKDNIDKTEDSTVIDTGVSSESNKSSDYEKVEKQYGPPIHDTINGHDTIFVPLKSETNTSLKQQQSKSYSYYNVYQHYIINEHYQINEKTTVKTKEKTGGVPFWVFVIVFVLGAAGGFWLSKFLSPTTLINEAETEYNKIKAGVLKKL